MAVLHPDHVSWACPGSDTPARGPPGSEHRPGPVVRKTSWDLDEVSQHIR